MGHRHALKERVDALLLPLDSQGLLMLQDFSIIIFLLLRGPANGLASSMWQGEI